MRHLVKHTGQVSKLLFISTTIFAGALALQACNSSKSVNPDVAGAAADKAAKDAADAEKNKATDKAKAMDPAALSCQADVCQDPNFLSFKNYKAPAVADTTKQQYQTAVKPLVTAKAALFTNTIKNYEVRLEKEEAGFKTLVLTDDQKKLVRALLLTHPSNAGTALLATSPDLLKSFADSIAKEDFAKSAMERNPLSYFKSLYPDQAMADAIASEAQFIRKTKDAIKATLGGEIPHPEDAVVAVAIAKAKLTDKELKNLRDSSQSYRALNFALSNVDLQPLLAKVDISTAQISDLINLTVSTRKSDMAKLASVQDKGTAACEDLYYASLANSPTQSELQSFQSQAVSVLAESATIVGEPLGSSIKKTNINFPLIDTEIASLWSTRLKTDADFLGQMDVAIKSVEPIVVMHADLLLSLNSLAFMDMQAQAAAQKVAAPKIQASDFANSLCGNLAAGHALSADIKTNSKAELVVSPSMVKFPMMGLAALAHQVGHIVEGNSSTASTDQEKQCLNANQDGKGTFVDEDFADLFSTQVSAGLLKNEQVSTGNLGCYIAVAEQSDKLTGNAQGNLAKSSGFFRLISIQVNLGAKVPDSCQALITAQNPNAAKICTSVR